jgi:hypothetical protein
MSNKLASFSRREFLRLAAIIGGSLAGSRLLSACGLAPATPTGTPAPTATATSVPTATGLPKPELIRFYPAVPSRVVQTHHSGAWNADKTLSPEVLRSMLDASITKLTGIADPREAWATLFRPGERIAIKVNAFSNSLIWTHAPLVQQVTDSLLEAGIAPEQITIYDAQTVELETAGYPVNKDGPGIRCVGTGSNVSAEPTDVIGKKIKLSNILKETDALINIPVLKSHMLSGITFAMKNHYGSFNYPGTLHSASMQEIAYLNALPEIKDRTRLIIGDALAANIRYANSYPYWKEDWWGDSIFMSFDPVAHDKLGLDLLVREQEKIGMSSKGTLGMAKATFQRAVELGLGTDDPANIEFIEQTIA